MLPCAKTSLLKPVTPFRTPAFITVQIAPALWFPHSDCDLVESDNIEPSHQSKSGAPMIYAVDDMRCLTELYTLVLESSGYGVRTFNDRGDALAALTLEREKPELLITDYRGARMSVESFLSCCRAIHPALRILLASGFSQTESRMSAVIADRFLQKPFTPGELQQAVKAVLPPA